MKYDAGRHFLSNQMIIGDDVVGTSVDEWPPSAQVPRALKGTTIKCTKIIHSCISWETTFVVQPCCLNYFKRTISQSNIPPKITSPKGIHGNIRTMEKQTAVSEFYRETDAVLKKSKSKAKHIENS